MRHDSGQEGAGQQMTAGSCRRQRCAMMFHDSCTIIHASGMGLGKVFFFMMPFFCQGAGVCI